MPASQGCRSARLRTPKRGRHGTLDGACARLIPMLIRLGANSERLNHEVHKVHEGKTRQSPFHFVFFVALLRVLRAEIFSPYFWQLPG
jgi:hypothetical protein